MKVHTENPTINLEDVHLGYKLAMVEMSDRTLDVTYSDLSGGDEDFLAAMLKDKENSIRSDLAERLNKPWAHFNLQETANTS